MAVNLASVNIRIGAQIGDMQKGLKQAERALIRSGKEMSAIGGNLTRSLSLPIAAAGAASLKFASDFETSFLKINTLVGISGDTLDSFKQGIANLSGPLGQSQTQLSDALFVITSAGQRGAEALDTLEAASKASAIGLGETSEIARAAVAAVQAYGAANLSSADAVDKLTAIVRAGNLEASELAPALGRVLPIASQLGVSFDEVGANIATFSRLGVSASESVTALKSLLSNLLKPSKEAATELERLGISADDLRKSVAENGLAATLQQLIVAYKGNTEGLAKLFGNVEGLANALGTAGAQGEDYLKIVNEIANSNGIVNEGFEKVSETAQFKMKKALVELQNVGVQLGGTLIPVVTDLLGAITPIISAFSNLNPTLQKIIVSSGLTVAATGPLLSVYGNLKTLIGGVGIAYRQLSGLIGIYIKEAPALRAAALASGESFSVMGAFVTKARTAWVGFNAVTKASVIGLAVTAVAALAAAVATLSDNFSTASKTAKALDDVNKTAADNIVRERIEAQQLIGVIKDETAAKEDKEAALRRLNEISPTYFKGLNIEKVSVDQLNNAYDKYVANLLKAAQAQAAQEKIVELEKERLGVLDRINKLASEGPTIGEQFDLIFSGQRTVGQNLQKQVQEIEAQQKALAQIGTSAAIENAKLQQAAVTVAAAPLQLRNAAAGTSKPSTGGATPAAPAFSGFGDVSGFQVINDAISQSSFGIQALNGQVGQYIETTAALEKVQQLTTLSIYDQAAAFEKLQQNMLIASEAGNLIGSALQQASEAGKQSINDLLAVTANAARKFIKIQIAQAIANAIKNAIGLGPLGLFLAPVAAGTAAALFENLVPKFATGGIVKSPTLALVGDNPNAASNPEYILRQDQLRSIAADVAPQGGGGGDYLPAFRLDGDTLMVWYERAAAKQARRRG